MDLALERQIGHLLQRLARFSRIHVRAAFEGLPISSIDEFTVLNILFHESGLQKTEVYEKAVLELTTGAQLVQRLIRLGLIDQRRSSTDRRAFELSLTKKGLAVRNDAFKILGGVVKQKYGGLSMSEKKALLSILQKLQSDAEESDQRFLDRTKP